MPTGTTKLLSGKVGQAATKWLGDTLKTIADQSTVASRIERGKTRVENLNPSRPFGLSPSLKELAPPIVPPRASELVQSASTFAPGSGDLSDAVSFASLTEELLSGTKKLDKSAVASLALGFAGIMLPGSLNPAPRENIARYMAGETQKHYWKNEARKISEGISRGLNRIPQKVLDEVDELSFSTLGSRTKGEFIRTMPAEEIMASFKNPSTLIGVKTKKKIQLSSLYDWNKKADPAKEVEDTLVHEFMHSSVGTGMEKGNKAEALIQLRENTLKTKVKKIKEYFAQQETEYPGRGTETINQRVAKSDQKLDSLAYKYSYHEGVANTGARDLQASPRPSTEEGRTMSYLAAFESSLDETLAKSSKEQANRILDDYYKYMLD